MRQRLFLAFLLLGLKVAHAARKAHAIGPVGANPEFGFQLGNFFSAGGQVAGEVARPVSDPPGDFNAVPKRPSGFVYRVETRDPFVALVGGLAMPNDFQAARASSSSSAGAAATSAASATSATSGGTTGGTTGGGAGTTGAAGNATGMSTGGATTGGAAAATTTGAAAFSSSTTGGAFPPPAAKPVLARMDIYPIDEADGDRPPESPGLLGPPLDWRAGDTAEFIFSNQVDLLNDNGTVTALGVNVQLPAIPPADMVLAARPRPVCIQPGFYMLAVRFNASVPDLLSRKRPGVDANFVVRHLYGEYDSSFYNLYDQMKRNANNQFYSFREPQRDAVAADELAVFVRGVSAQDLDSGVYSPPDLSPETLGLLQDECRLHATQITVNRMLSVNATGAARFGGTVAGQVVVIKWTLLHYVEGGYGSEQCENSTHVEWFFSFRNGTNSSVARAHPFWRMCQHNDGTQREAWDRGTLSRAYVFVPGEGDFAGADLRYRVGCDDPGHKWSPILRVRAAKAATSQSVVSWLGIGMLDRGNTAIKYSKQAAAAYVRDGDDFVLVPGSMGGQNTGANGWAHVKRTWLWDYMLDRWTGAAPGIELYAARNYIDDHRGRSGWDARWAPTAPDLDVSSRRAWYSFDVGFVHVLVVSSEDPISAGSEQYDFVSSDLRAAALLRAGNGSSAVSGTEWIVVAAQKAMYKICDDPCMYAHEQNGRDDSIQLPDEQFRNDLEPLMLENGVDLYIFGGGGTFEITYPVDAASAAANFTPPPGSGTSGDPVILDDVTPPAIAKLKLNSSEGIRAISEAVSLLNFSFSFLSFPNSTDGVQTANGTFALNEFGTQPGEAVVLVSCGGNFSTLVAADRALLTQSLLVAVFAVTGVEPQDIRNTSVLEERGGTVLVVIRLPPESPPIHVGVATGSTVGNDLLSQQCANAVGQWPESGNGDPFECDPVGPPYRLGYSDRQKKYGHVRFEATNVGRLTITHINDDPSAPPSYSFLKKRYFVPAATTGTTGSAVTPVPFASKDAVSSSPFIGIGLVLGIALPIAVLFIVGGLLISFVIWRRVTAKTEDELELEDAMLALRMKPVVGIAIISRVGQHSDSKTFKGSYHGSQVAVRLVERTRKARTQLKLWSKLNHPNVVHLHGACCSEDISDSNDFLTALPDPKFAAVMEWCPQGRLDSVLQNSDDVDIGQLLAWGGEALAAVSYMVDEGVAVEVIKAGAFLVGSDNTLRFAGFGDRVFGSMAQPPVWSPPEKDWVLGQSEAHLWATCAWQILSRCADAPWGADDGDPEDVREAVQKRDLLTVASPMGCPRDLYELFVECWNADPGARPPSLDVVLGKFDSAVGPRPQSGSAVRSRTKKDRRDGASHKKSRKKHSRKKGSHKDGEDQPRYSKTPSMIVEEGGEQPRYSKTPSMIVEDGPSNDEKRYSRTPSMVGGEDVHAGSSSSDESNADAGEGEYGVQSALPPSAAQGNSGERGGQYSTPMGSAAQRPEKDIEQRLSHSDSDTEPNKSDSIDAGLDGTGSARRSTSTDSESFSG